MVGDGQCTNGSHKSAMIYKSTRFDILTKEKMAPFNLKFIVFVSASIVFNISCRRSCPAQLILVLKDFLSK